MKFHCQSRTAAATTTSATAVWRSLRHLLHDDGNALGSARSKAEARAVGSPPKKIFAQAQLLGCYFCLAAGQTPTGRWEAAEKTVPLGVHPWRSPSARSQVQ